MKYTIHHKTAYTYFDPVSLCHNVARLLPRDTETQSCKHININITPEPDTFEGYDDFFGNKVIYFSIEKEHRQLVVSITSEIEKYQVSANDGIVTSQLTVEEARKELELASDEVRQYCFDTPMTAWNEEIERYAQQFFQPGRPVFDATKELMEAIHADFIFQPGVTIIATPLSTVMKQRKGVCQDFAHLALACTRSAGLAARYVSGYIETIPPPGVEKLTGADASHAWFSVYMPGNGWVDFDPTNNLLPSDQHITIGWGRDYADIAPLKGVVLSSGPHELTVSVDVKREAKEIGR